MQCSYCEKSIDSTFAFCPHCGKKIGTKLTNFTRIDWFCCNAGREDASKEWDKIREMDFQKASEYLSERIPSFNVWTIGGKYTKNAENRYKREKQTCHFACMQIKEVIRTIQLAVGGFYSDLVFVPVEQAIKKSYLKELGISVFFSKEECLKTINKMVEENTNAEGKEK